MSKTAFILLAFIVLGSLACISATPTERPRASATLTEKPTITVLSGNPYKKPSLPDVKAYPVTQSEAKIIKSKVNARAAEWELSSVEGEQWVTLCENFRFAAWEIEEVAKLQEALSLGPYGSQEFNAKVRSRKIHIILSTAVLETVRNEDNFPSPEGMSTDVYFKRSSLTWRSFVKGFCQHFPSE